MMGNLVLVIDDSNTICGVIEACLRREGYEVVSASSGEAAIRWLAEALAVPNLVFVDLLLPKMDGYSVIQHLRAKPVFEHVPFVIITRCDGLINRLKSRIIGASHYIVKPFKTEEIIAVVQTYLENPLPVGSS